MRVVFIDQHRSSSNLAIMQELYDKAGLELRSEQCDNEDQIIERCSDADALMSVYTVVGEKAMSALKKCKVIVRTGIGYDNLDVDAATKYGIKICNIPHYSVPEVSAHSTALILAITRHLQEMSADAKNGEWRSKRFSTFYYRRPDSQQVGLVGFGAIGRAVALQLKPFGYKVVAYDPYVPDNYFEEFDVKRVSLDELIQSSDIISLHTAATAETIGIINKDNIAKMKDNVFIVNTARGSLINEQDLIEALKSGKVAGAGLDVTNPEPPVDPNHPYYSMDNVILTPHIAFRSIEASKALSEGVANTVISVLAGNNPDNIVNKKALGL